MVHGVLCGLFVVLCCSTVALCGISCGVCCFVVVLYVFVGVLGVYRAAAVLQEVVVFSILQFRLFWPESCTSSTSNSPVRRYPGCSQGRPSSLLNTGLFEERPVPPVIFPSTQSAAAGKPSTGCAPAKNELRDSTRPARRALCTRFPHWTNVPKKTCEVQRGGGKSRPLATGGNVLRKAGGLDA